MKLRRHAIDRRDKERYLEWADSTESDVAEAVYRAANDATGQLRFPAGTDAVALAMAQSK